MVEPLPDWAREELEAIQGKLEYADEKIDPYADPPTNEGDAADSLIPYEELTNARAMLQVVMIKDDLARQNKTRREADAATVPKV